MNKKELEEKYDAVFIGGQRAEVFKNAYSYAEFMNRASLYDYYANFSYAKYDAYTVCQDIERKDGGHSGRVISANTFAFVYAYFINSDLMKVITRCNNYLIRMND